MKESNLVRDLVAEIAAVAATEKIEPNQLTKSVFLEKCDPKFTEWSLRKVGGFAALLKSHFPILDKELKSITYQKQQSGYIQKLEKQIGNQEMFRDQLIEDVGAEIAKIEINPIQLDKNETKKYLTSIASTSNNSLDNAKRSLVSIWSDQHFGSNIEAEEVGGMNAYNWVIGARRLGMLCEQLATYKIEKRNLHEEMVILLLGDNIAGVIHNQEGNANDLISSQCAGAAYYYMQAIMYLKQFFPRIRVICQPGNHGRVMHKVSKDRALQQKWDSYENMVCYGLSMKFAHDPNVIFETTKAPFSDVVVQGHHLYATHGDTVFDTGNVGKVVNIAKIEHQISRVNMEAAHRNSPQYEMFCTGHVHHPLMTHVGPGVKVVINGCLIGTDPYAHAVGVHSSTPVQVLWETTKHFVQGDVRHIYVEKADSNSKYEKIIRPYNYELSVPKLI